MAEPSNTFAPQAMEEKRSPLSRVPRLRDRANLLALQRTRLIGERVQRRNRQAAEYREVQKRELDRQIAEEAVRTIALWNEKEAYEPRIFRVRLARQEQILKELRSRSEELDREWNLGLRAEEVNVEMMRLFMEERNGTATTLEVASMRTALDRH